MNSFYQALAAGMLFLLLTVFPAVAGDGGLRIARDEEIEQALKTMARPIFDAAGLSADNVRFILVEDNDLNAFVAGGQNIFINTGLILRTKNAAELIGVIAHETGHIASGHLFRAREAVDDLSLQVMLARALGIAVAIGTKSSDAGIAIGTAGQSFAERSILRHSRTQESAADQAGVRFLKDQRLPLDGFLSFMQTLESQELLPESQQTQYIRTHPLTQDRVDFLRHAVETGPAQPELPAAWQDMHARMKAKLLGFLFPVRALQNKETGLPARYARAIAHYRQGKTSKALEILSGLLTEEPANPWFLELKGQILFESGRLDEACAAYARSLEQYNGSGLIQAAYGHALLETAGYGAKLDKKKLDLAIGALQLSLESEPRQPETHRLLATAYGKKGEEGLSRLHLAEEALLKSNRDFAKTEATLAQKALAKNTPGWLRAQDILDLLSKKTDKRK